MIRTADDLNKRFLKELSNIENYFQFTELKLSSLKSDIKELENILFRNSIFKEKFDTLTFLSEYKKTITPDQRFKEIFDELPNIEKRLDILDKEINDFKYPEKLGTIDGRTELGELILAFKEILKSGQKNVTDLKTEYLEKLKPQEENFTLHLFNISTITDIETAIDYSIESAQYLNLTEEYHNLDYLVNRLKYIDVMLKMSNEKENLSFIRQGFILLMTVFDATVFDLMKILLNDHFFKLIGLFSKEKISFESFKDYNDFEEFKSTLIDMSLNKKYLKEIMFILKSLEIELTLKKDDFPKLIELVMRRNIHVHNLGIIDERYLAKNTKDSIQFNIYDLKIGDYATIDLEYWDHAKEHCKYCVNSIATWINKNAT